MVGKRRTHNEFVNEMRLINPEIEIVGTFVNTSTRIKCKCKRCGHEWETKPSHLLAGHGCVKCMARKLSDTKRMPQEEFVSRIAIINPSIIVKGEYIDRNTRVKCQCRKCGNVWMGLPVTMLRGTGCPKCSNEDNRKRLAKTQEQFEEELEIANPDIEAIGEYVNANTPIRFRCKKCDYEWDAQPSSILNQGTGCPRCVRYLKVSFPETAFFYYIRQLFPKTVQTHKAFGIEIDIYIPEVRKGIEYDGVAWHKNKYRADSRKTILCEKNGIELIHIREHGLRPLKTGKCILRSDNESNESLVDSIKELLHYLSPRENVSVDVNRDINDIYELIPHQNQTDLFINRMAVVNQEIEVLGKYYQARKPIKCRCKTCGYEWEITPDNLLRGHGCPSCAGKAKRSHEVFLEEIELANPEIEVVGQYLGLAKKIRCKCKKCGYEWEPRADHLLEGHGCPNCSMRKGGRRKTQEEFEEDLANVCPDIEVVGEYVNARRDVRCRCKICGYEWESKPVNLLRSLNCTQ